MTPAFDRDLLVLQQPHAVRVESSAHLVLGLQIVVAEHRVRASATARSGASARVKEPGEPRPSMVRKSPVRTTR